MNELNLLEKLIHPWHAAVIPLFGCNDIGSRADGVGSAFLLLHDGLRLLITADHVLDSLLQYKMVTATINGHGVVFDKQPFGHNRKADIACTELSNEWLVSQGVSELLTTVNLPAIDEPIESLGIFSVIGYPASKNELRSKWGELDRHSYAITIGRSTKQVKCDIPGYMAFEYDHKQLLNGEGQKLGPQASLRGMSGGPCLELVRTPAGVKMFRPIGVFVEHHWRERVLIASPLDKVLL